MSLAIGIKVDHRQVTEARKEIDVFNRSLTEAHQHSTIVLGVGDGSNLNETAALLAKIREEIARMGELSGAGRGLIQKEQFAEAGDLAKRVRDDIRTWTTEIDNAKDALKKLAVEKANLRRGAAHNKRQQATDQADPSASRLDAITAKEKEALARIKHLQDQKAKVFPLEDRALRPVTTVKERQLEKWAEGMPLERQTRTTPTAPQMEWLPRERPQVLEAAKKEQLQGDRQPRATSPTPQIHGQGEPSSKDVSNAEGLNIPAWMAKTREEVRRMGELSRAATTRGGLLPKKQFEEAEGLGKRVQVSFSKWTDEIDKARESLKKLAAEKENIGRDFMMGRVAPDHMQARMEREAAIEGEEKAARERLAYMEKQQAKLQPLQDRARQYSGVLANAGTDPEQQGTSMKKALGWALAAAGGFSVMSFLSQSRGKYQEYVGHEDQLYARGVRDISAGGGAAAAYGVDPMEHYALQEQLTRSMGLSGKRLGRMGYNTEMFAKAYGMNTSEVGGFGASIYQATGSRDFPASTLIAMQQQGIEKTRMPETMKLVEGHLRVMADARKGAGLGEGSVATALALATAAMREKDPGTAAYLKSGNLMNTLQNGLQGAGSPAGEIAIFNAVGGFNGPMTYSKIHEMNMLRAGGFMERPDLMAKLLADMPKGLDRAGKAGWLETKFPQWAQGKSSELLLSLFDPEGGALTGMRRNQLGGNESGALAAMLRQIKENPAYAKKVREAMKTDLKARAGEGIDAIVSPIEITALEGSESILNSDFVNTVFKGNEKKIVKEKLSRESTKLPYYKEMLAASKKHGVAVELLLAVAKQESGFDANAVSPKGAMGIMQLMPVTAKALGVKNPMNAGENIDGAAKHLAYLGKKYKWNMQAMLGAYNEGETKYDKYGIAGGGEETRNYVANVRGDFMNRTGLTRLPEDETVGQRISSDMSGMVSLSFEAVKVLLTRIADALEKQPAAPVHALPLPIKR